MPEHLELMDPFGFPMCLLFIYELTGFYVSFVIKIVEVESKRVLWQFQAPPLCALYEQLRVVVFPILFIIPQGVICRSSLVCPVEPAPNSTQTCLHTTTEDDLFKQCRKPSWPNRNTRPQT